MVLQVLREHQLYAKLSKYHSHGFDTEPGWAMLVDVEARVSERIVVEVDKIRILTQGFNIEPGWAR